MFHSNILSKHAIFSLKFLFIYMYFMHGYASIHGTYCSINGASIHVFVFLLTCGQTFACSNIKWVRIVILKSICAAVVQILINYFF